MLINLIYINHWNYWSHKNQTLLDNSYIWNLNYSYHTIREQEISNYFFNKLIKHFHSTARSHPVYAEIFMFFRWVLFIINDSHVHWRLKWLDGMRVLSLYSEAEGSCDTVTSVKQIPTFYSLTFFTFKYFYHFVLLTLLLYFI